MALVSITWAVGVASVIPRGRSGLRVIGAAAVAAVAAAVAAAWVATRLFLGGLLGVPHSPHHYCHFVEILAAMTVTAPLISVSARVSLPQRPEEAIVMLAPGASGLSGILPSVVAAVD